MAFSIKRHRRRIQHHPHVGRRLSPLAIAGITVGAVILLTLVVGNILNATLDEDAYLKLTEGKTEEEAPNAAPPAYGVQIQAPAFVLGEDPTILAGYSGASVAINHADGSLTYTSPVATYQGMTCDTPVLSDTLTALRTVTPTVSGVYRVQGLQELSSELIHAKAMADGALLREFLTSGGSEVVLIDLPFDTLPLPMILEYIRGVYAAVGEDAALGVAVPLQVAERENGWEILSSLLEECRFCTLDLRGEEVTDPTVNDLGISTEALEILSRCEYYRKGYGMRLMIAESAEALSYAVQYRMLPNYQMIQED